jgi:hypothetical protein
MSETKIHRLDVKPICKSRAKLLKLIPTKTVISGQQFDISFSFKNVGESAFPGCIFRWKIIWPSSQEDRGSFNVPALNKKESWISTPHRTDALCDGYGLIFIGEIPRLENALVQLVIEGKEFRGIQELGDSIRSVNTRSSQEIYAVWGLLISAFGLGIIALEKIIMFLQWLIGNWPS